MLGSVIATFGLLAASAGQEGRSWQLVNLDPAHKVVLFVDRNSITGTLPVRRADLFFVDGSGDRVAGMVATYEFDCDAARHRGMHITVFSREQVALGSETGPTAWKPSPADTGWDRISNFVCEAVTLYPDQHYETELPLRQGLSLLDGKS